MGEKYPSSAPVNDSGLRTGTYTIDYFLDLARNSRAGQKDGNIKWIVCGNVSKALARNPNLMPAQLEMLLAPNIECDRREILQIILSREDKQAFMDPVFSVMESSDDNLTVQRIGTTILSASDLSDHHPRAMKSLMGLKDRRDYHHGLKEYLQSPCISYRFFIEYMLRNAASVDEAERWLGEYLQFEELDLRNEQKVRGTQDPVAWEKYVERDRAEAEDRASRYLASNPHLPSHYLKKFYAYADSIEDESARTSLWGILLANPNIPAGDYQEIFETKRHQLRDKGQIVGLIASLGRNPNHYRLYFDFILEYVEKKPTDTKYKVLNSLMDNPRLSSEELDQVIDVLCRRKYDLDFNFFSSVLGHVGWSIVTLLKRKDLTGGHQEKIRNLVVRILDMVKDSDRYLGKDLFNEKLITGSHFLLIFSLVRLDDEFVKYLSGFVVNKGNSGVFLSGLLPNPDLKKGQFDWIVAILEEQYVGREDRFLITQRSTFFAEKMYGYWPASSFVK